MKHLSFLLIIICFTLIAREEDTTHVLEGNLALPTSQEPGPLFCLGQNIVDKGDIQGFLITNTFGRNNNNFTQVIPNFIYGIRDDFSLYAGIPIDTQFTSNHIHPTGMEDIFVQFEYAFHNKDKPTYANQATVVANVAIPYKASNRHSSSESNTTSFLLGLTANHMSCDWYIFGSTAIQLSLSKNCTNFGKSFYYQWGLSKNLYYVSSKRILTLLVEFFGIYTQADTYCGKKQNSASNVFYIGPCLWYSTPRLILQAGIAFPVIQKVNGLTKNNYFLAFEAGWKFNT